MSLEKKIAYVEGQIEYEIAQIEALEGMKMQCKENIASLKKTLKKLNKVKESVDEIFEEAGLVAPPEEPEELMPCEYAFAECECDECRCATDDTVIHAV